jgi:hypothetical protein
MSYIKGDGKMTEKRITVRLDGGIANWVRQKAKERETTISKIVRDALAAYMDEDYQLYKKIVAQIGMQKLLEEVNKHE